MLVCSIGLFILIIELYESILHPTDDVYVFQAVGRGILKGLVLYRDLLETKPPGILLLHASSMDLFGDRTLLEILSGVFSLVYLASVVGAGYYSARGFPFWAFMLVFGGGLLAGLAVRPLLAARAAWPDFYASVLCVLYALSLLVPFSWKSGVLIGSLCVFGVAFLREPLLPVFLAAGILLVRADHREIVSGLVLTIFGGSALWLTVMAVLGYVRPYLEVYLPSVLIRSGGEPVFVRGLKVGDLLDYLWSTSPFLLLALIAMTAVVVLPSSGEPTDKPWSAAALRALRFLTALFLTMIAVHPLDANVPYYAFAIPFYVALCFFWLRQLRHAIINRRRSVMWASTGITVLLGLAIVSYPLLSVRAATSEQGPMDDDTLPRQ